ncbi:MAG: MOSC domain-containing protein [Candidatus Omnitrophota bacterium]
MQGKVFSINISKNKGVSKNPVKKAILIENMGIENDAHLGFEERQVSLLSKELIQEQNNNLKPGDFAENITTSGIDLSKIQIADRIKINKTILEVTGIGKTCHDKCNIYKKIGNCVMPKQGIFAKVLKGGLIKIGDRIAI